MIACAERMARIRDNTDARRNDGAERLVVARLARVVDRDDGLGT